MLEKILVPTDFSPCADYALSYAAEIARKSKADLRLLHALQVPMDWVNINNELLNKFPELKDKVGTSKEKLENMIKKIEAKGETATQTLKIIPNYSGVAQASKEEASDLVVAGSHGANVNDLFSLGSNAEKLIRNSSMPVLIVKKEPEKVIFDTIVYASGLEKDTHVSFEWLLNFAKIMETKHLHFVAVTTPNNFRPTSEVMSEMEKYVSKHDFPHIWLHIYNHYTIEAGIVEFAKSVDADLVAIANHGRSDLTQIFVDSIPENLVKYTDLPILSLRV